MLKPRLLTARRLRVRSYIFSDPAKLALPPTYSTPTQEVLLRLAVKRPPKQSFFRVHPGEDLRQHVSLLQHGGEIVHFVGLVACQQLPEVITPYESRESVRLVLAEKQSARTKRTVVVE